MLVADIALYCNRAVTRRALVRAGYNTCAVLHVDNNFVIELAVFGKLCKTYPNNIRNLFVIFVICALINEQAAINHLKIMHKLVYSEVYGFVCANLGSVIAVNFSLFKFVA